MKNNLRRLYIPLLLCVAAAACSGRPRNTKTDNTAPTPIRPVWYGYTVVASYPHLRTSYTQGLQYAGGEMWEGTGERGSSVLQRIDLESGEANVVARLPRSEFGEGITLLGDKIYQLTWTSNKAHVYDAASGRKLRTFLYAGEGWGLTTDGSMLYMSDGTETIDVRDPATFDVKRRITVTLEGEPLRLLNELEWIDGRIWANVYTTDYIVIIDPSTGVVEGIADMRGLLPDEERDAATDVLNGIAYDAATGRIFVTGKNWSRIYEITLHRQ